MNILPILIPPPPFNLDTKIVKDCTCKWIECDNGDFHPPDICDCPFLSLKEWEEKYILSISGVSEDLLGVEEAAKLDEA